MLELVCVFVWEEFHSINEAKTIAAEIFLPEILQFIVKKIQSHI